MAASLKGKRTPITTPPYQVPSVDITPDPPIFSLVTTVNKTYFYASYWSVLQAFDSHWLDECANFTPAYLTIDQSYAACD